MKNITLLLAFLIVLPIGFTGCTKDNPTPSQTPSDLIQGTWNFNNYREEYYNDAGAKVYERTGAIEISKVSFDKTNGIIYFNNGQPDQNVTYVINNNNNKNTLSLMYLGTPYAEFELSVLDNSNMTWYSEQTGTIAYTENGVSKSAKTVKRFVIFSK
ncbi:hypothetical protein [Adhaeribacter aquaticus]|uniref:hypothetical protein n=1 Tax=Adhaeribacter aquaticus TaxID=299567 RepID=UPI00040D0F53|nr:hypothetical protein [Adhaeribacter aquaticus]